MTTKTQKRLTIHDIRKEDADSVYVFNTSHLTRKNGVHQRLNFTVNLGNGEDKVVDIPITFIPVDLAYQVQKAKLLDSGNFMQAVNRRYITLVSSAEAEEIMNNEDSQVELERIIAKLNSDDVNLDDDILDDDIYAAKQNLPKLDRAKTKQELIDADIMSKVNPKIIDICTHGEDQDPMEVYSMLKVLATALKEDDYQYLKTNLPQNLKTSKIMKLIDTVE